MILKKIRVQEELGSFHSYQNWLDKGVFWYRDNQVTSDGIIAIAKDGTILKDNEAIAKADRQGNLPVTIYKI